MPRKPLPAALTDGPFTTGEARAAGVGRSRLRASDLTHPHHGIHVVGADASDLETRCRRLLPALRPDHVFSHRTAARLWGIPLEQMYRPDEGIHVLTIGAGGRVRHRGVVGWHTADERTEVRRLGGLPVAAPATVWTQLAARNALGPGRWADHEWLVAAGDHLVSGTRLGGGRRTRPLCGLQDLESAVTRSAGARGVARLRLALSDIRSPVDSPRETLLRLGLTRAGLPEPTPQLPVLTAAGWRSADLGYAAARLLLEYQGDEHRVSRARWLQDLTRVQLFQDAGYEVLLVGSHDVVPDCSALAARVRRALARRA